MTDDPSINEETLAELQAATEALYDLRANFFNKYGIELVGQKNDIIKRDMQVITAKVDRLLQPMGNAREAGRTKAAAKLDKAYLLFLKGKSLNVLPDYDAVAEEALSKSIKLDPGRLEAWNSLGECLWKKEDVEGAKDCFECALNHENNKVSLRNLSMVYRQLPSTSAEEKLKIVQKSIAKGKEAVALDVRDGTSWMVLGNTYLSSFFMASQDARLLSQALAAYKNAERDPIANQDSHFHYNRAVVYNYTGRFTEALAEHKLASKLEPGWQDPVDAATTISLHVTNICEGLKNATAKIDSVALHRLKATSVKLKGKKIPTLSAKNSTPAQREMGCVLLQVLYVPDTKKEQVYKSAIVTDKDKNLFLLTLYNMPAEISIKEETVVTVLCPQVSSSVLGDDTDVSVIRVDHPSFIWIDGEHITQAAQTVLKIVAQSE